MEKDFKKMLAEIFLFLDRENLQEEKANLEFHLALNLFFMAANKSNRFPAPFAATINDKNGVDDVEIQYNPDFLEKMVEANEMGKDDLKKFIMGAMIHEVRHIARGDLWSEVGKGINNFEATLLNYLMDAAIHAALPDITQLLGDGIVTPDKVPEILNEIGIILAMNPKNDPNRIRQFLTKWNENWADKLDPKLWNVIRFPNIPRAIVFPDEFVAELKTFEYPKMQGKGGGGRGSSNSQQNGQGGGNGNKQNQNQNGKNNQSGEGSQNQKDNQNGGNGGNDITKEQMEKIKDVLKKMQNQQIDHIPFDEMEKVNGGEGPSDMSKQRMAGKLQAAMEEVVKKFGDKVRGLVPGIYEEFIKKIFKVKKVPKLKGEKDAAAVIKRKLRSVKRPDKKLGIPPTFVKTEGQYLVVIVDTSCSMSTEELQLAAGFVEKFRKQGFGVILVEIDTFIRDIKWIRQAGWWKRIAFKGRGGTALEMLGEEFPERFKGWEAKIKRAPWIIITDGGTGYPEKKPNSPKHPVVIIRTHKDGNVPEWEHKLIDVEIPVGDE